MFRIIFTKDAALLLDEMRRTNHPKLKKVHRTLALLENNPRHPGLHSHKWQAMGGPGGADLWESYIENRTPAAWRIWWIYGPESDQISVVMFGAHP